MVRAIRFRRRHRYRGLRKAALLAFSLVGAGCIALTPTGLPRQVGMDNPSDTATVENGGDPASERDNARKGRGLAPKRTGPSTRGAVLIDRVTRVRDGDTIVVGLIPIRISNLDCAESGTVTGDRATRRVRELVAGQTLTCRLEGRRSYDREVGACALESGQDFGEVLITERYCARWRG